MARRNTIRLTNVFQRPWAFALFFVFFFIFRLAFFVSLRKTNPFVSHVFAFFALCRDGQAEEENKKVYIRMLI